MIDNLHWDQHEYLKVLLIAIRDHLDEPVSGNVSLATLDHRYHLCVYVALLLVQLRCFIINVMLTLLWPQQAPGIFLFAKVSPKHFLPGVQFILSSLLLRQRRLQSMGRLAQYDRQRRIVVV